MRIKTILVLGLLLLSMHLVAQESKPVAVIPFEFRNDKIIIKLKINDSPRVLNMLFDTGADGVGMKKEVADAIGLKETRKQLAQVVGGSTEIIISAGNTLHFDTLQIKNQSIGIFPAYKDDMDGLFGANFLRNFITYIDFDHSVINLYKFGKINYPEGGTKVPLDYTTGLPGIQGKVKLNSGKEIQANFHFDTGAGYPLIFFGPSVKQNELDKDFAVQFKSTTYSLGHETATLNGIIDLLELGEYIVPHFTGTLQGYIDGMATIGKNNDGSLGIKIISKFNCFLNLPAKEFYLIPNKSFNNPIDFWLNKNEFGFVDGQLIIKQASTSSQYDQSVPQRNDAVLSINGIRSDEFKDLKIIKQLEEASLKQPLVLEIARNGPPMTITVPN
jgi:hypothetical protein